MRFVRDVIVYWNVGLKEETEDGIINIKLQTATGNRIIKTSTNQHFLMLLLTQYRKFVE